MTIVLLQFEEAACDARFVDVYKGCHGVILVFDLTKQWTWEYVTNELKVVPSHVPVSHRNHFYFIIVTHTKCSQTSNVKCFQVLILANRRDMGHHRQVTDEMIARFVDDFNRFVVCTFIITQKNYFRICLL